MPLGLKLALPRHHKFTLNYIGKASSDFLTSWPHLIKLHMNDHYT